MTVSVIVPWRPAPSRAPIWSWLIREWHHHHPGWGPVIEGDPGPGPWCKAAAVDDALQRAHGDILVIADADVWIGPAALESAVRAVEQGAAWAVPHHSVWRLGPQTTADVLAGRPWPTVPANRADQRIPEPFAERSYRGRQGGGMVVLPRTVYEACPLDPRFQGWGQEDEAWGLALEVIYGPPVRPRPPDAPGLWHLWHQPAPRRDRGTGSDHSAALHGRYRSAMSAHDAPAAMRALVREAKTWSPNRAVPAASG